MTVEYSDLTCGPHELHLRHESKGALTAIKVLPVRGAICTTHDMGSVVAEVQLRVSRQHPEPIRTTLASDDNDTHGRPYGAPN